jgi:hypothetical protein
MPDPLHDALADELKAALETIERLTRERDRWEILVSSKTANAVLLELGKMGKVIDERDEAIRTADENRKGLALAEAEIRNLGAENARLREALEPFSTAARNLQAAAAKRGEPFAENGYVNGITVKECLAALAAVGESNANGPNRQRG